MIRIFSIILLIQSLVFAQVSLSDINRLTNKQIDAIKSQLQDNAPVVETDKSIDLITPGNVEVKTPGNVEVKTKSAVVLDTNFGYQYFKRDINFYDNIPVPVNYKLGPGDEIILSLWGETNKREKFVISRDGSIFYEKIGFINISNKTLSEAESVLKDQLSKIFSTLNDNSQKTKLSLDTGRLKSINIYFSGEVINPGINIIHPFSDIFTALIQAGGVNDNGSLRNVELIRDGRSIATVDFYQFFMNGTNNFSSIKILDGDVIHVPLVSKRIPIGGAVKRGGSYEMLPNESIERLINFAGGLTANASSIINIESVIPIDKRVSDDFATSSYDINFEDTKDLILNDGDKVNIRNIAESSSKVEIIGYVKSPGLYSASGNSLKDVLNQAGGFNDPIFRKSIFEDQIIVLRKDETQKYSIEFNLSYTNSDDFSLVAEDKIFVYQNDNFESSRLVNISGEVVKRGSYQLREGMTIQDIVNLAGGFTPNANINAIALSLQTQRFNSSGELIKQSENILGATLDYEIIDNASITILPRQNVVTVTGNVINPGTFNYTRKSLKRYISQAGGLKPDTLKKNIYVQRAAGQIEKVGVLRGSGIIIQPGDKIVVPKNENPRDFDITSFVADFASTLANVAAILVILDNQTN